MSNVSTLAIPGLNLVDSNAFQYGPKGDLPPELAIREQAINRRQQLANILLQRATQGQAGQMVGRFYVPNYASGIAALGAGLAGYGATLANERERGQVADENTNMVAQALERYKQQTGPQNVEQTIQGPGAPVISDMGKEVVDQTNESGPMSVPPESRQGFLEKQPPFYSEGPQPTATMQQPASPDQRRQALVDLMASQHPRVAALGAMMQKQEADAAEKQANRDFLSQEKDLDRANRLQMAEGQLNQALMLGLITKEQKDQMLELQRQQVKQTADLKKLEIEAKREQAQVGKTPPGYRQTPEGNLEAIPGGPADLKQQGMLNQDTAMLQNSNAAMDRLAASANEILNHPGLSGITGAVGKVPDFPGSDAANARALLNTLKSQVGFGVLQEMRNNSKTGGALGAVSDAEGKRLENNLAALDTTQGIDQFKKQLQAIIDYANGAKDRLRDAYNMKHKTGQPMPMTPSTGKGPAVGTVEDGYRFKGGDASKAENWEKVP